MRTVLICSAVIACVVCAGSMPAKAMPPPVLGIGNSNYHVTPVEKVGYRRRYYRGYGYGYQAPYAYYPPAYGYYPPAYGYYPAYRYPYYAPYRYYQPYYAPY
jgi:hypothetical protein